MSATTIIATAAEEADMAALRARARAAGRAALATADGPVVTVEIRSHDGVTLDAIEVERP